MDSAQDYHEEIPVKPSPRTTSEPGLGSRKRQQAARCKVLPVENRPLPRWPIPRIDEEAVHCQMLVVPSQDPDRGAGYWR